MEGSYELLNLLRLKSTRRAGARRRAVPGMGTGAYCAVRMLLSSQSLSFPIVSSFSIMVIVHVDDPDVPLNKLLSKVKVSVAHPLLDAVRLSIVNAWVPLMSHTSLPSLFVFP
jgi:hypothetical protein